MKRDWAEIIRCTLDVLEKWKKWRPMTLRQIYYQLVPLNLFEHNLWSYQALSRKLVEAREKGIIPWEWIEDRLRRPRHVAQWDGLEDFAEKVVGSYKRDVWEGQELYFEFWLEKDALSGIFETLLRPYGITLNVGRGFDSSSSVRETARRFGSGEDVRLFIFGDHDPSGEDIIRSLRERLAEFNCNPEKVKLAILKEDIERYNLPPALAKRTDSRTRRFVERFGDECVELDALSPDVLEARILGAVTSSLNMEAFNRVRQLEAREREKLAKVLTPLLRKS